MRVADLKMVLHSVDPNKQWSITPAASQIARDRLGRIMSIVMELGFAASDEEFANEFLGMKLADFEDFLQGAVLGLPAISMKQLGDKLDLCTIMVRIKTAGETNQLLLEITQTRCQDLKRALDCREEMIEQFGEGCEKPMWK